MQPIEMLTVAKYSLKHEDIMMGGTLDLTMGSEASAWGTGITDVPSSMSSD